MDSQQSKQSTSSVLMIRPVNFGYNEETASSNKFQVASSDNNSIQEKALREFNAFVEKLIEADIDVYVFNDSPSHYTPDSIFPNNWVTFHEDGRVVLYPMEAHNRRLERKLDIITDLRDVQGFDIKEIIDLSFFENENMFLEGTGSMILDRQNKIAYACLSSRTHPEVLYHFCELFNYKPVTFLATDKLGSAIYHTNVVMEVGENIAILCSETIADKDEKEKIIEQLKQTNKKIIEVTFDQMLRFAGNMLQLKDGKGNLVLVMSEQGYKSLTSEQVTEISSVTKILHSNIEHIERFGGGSARCMIAEIFNKKKIS